jgi:hypothetical protein
LARSILCTGASRRAVVLCALALALIQGAAPAWGAGRRSPSLAPNDTEIVGPTAGIVGLDGMSVARDGTGGLVYVQDVAGVAHVFVSVLAGGNFQPPVQVDAGLLGPSSQPVIAAGQSGLLLVAFINGGQLYVSQSATPGAPLSAPMAVYPHAANPSLSLSNFGKAYLAFTATDGGGGGEVRTAYYFQGQWALEPTPLDANPADAAGTGTGSPQVATAGDGTAIVVWGENGHVYSRRVVKTTPSVVYEQADVPSLNGWQEVSAGDPVVAAGGDSSYASVAFREVFASGAAQQSRVLMNRLHGSQYDGIVQGDGIATGGPEGADEPATAVTEYGEGFVTSEHDQTHELFASTLTSNDAAGLTERVDSLPNSTAPDAVPATAGLVSTLIAWQQSPGTAGPAEIRVRYAQDGADLGPEMVVSSPTLGPTDADLGLVAAGDVSGDAAVAWVQGSGANSYIVAAQLYDPPGGFVPLQAFRYSTAARPTLGWSPSAELWGAPQYVVRVDGGVVAQTTGLAATTLPLTNGRHSYQVTAVNQAGLSTAANSATVFVDTVAPRVSFKLTGSRVVDAAVGMEVSYADLPPAGLPRSAASGVKTVYVNWGTGANVQIRRTTARHIYTRKRTYTVTVSVADRAGNVTVVSKKITIKPKPKPKRKRRTRRPRRAHRASLAVARLTIAPAGGGRR